MVSTFSGASDSMVDLIGQNDGPIGQARFGSHYGFVIDERDGAIYSSECWYLRKISYGVVTTIDGKQTLNLVTKMGQQSKPDFPT